MFTVKRSSTDRVLELGGGDNPAPGVDVNVDIRPGPKVHFTQDFDAPLTGIGDEDFDTVISQFVIEHLSWRKVRQFVSEVFRITKSGGRIYFITANTEAQLNHIRNNPNNWEDRPLFEACSCILFGDQDYPENTHKNFMSPTIAIELFSSAGFENITISPFGNLGTDMAISADKPFTTAIGDKVIVVPGRLDTNNDPPGELLTTEQAFKTLQIPSSEHQVVSQSVTDITNVSQAKVDVLPAVAARRSASEIYDHKYFDVGGAYGQLGYWDHPKHDIITQRVLDRDPKSVLELGCGRGYILKRLQDRGIHCHGLEVSQHCFMTRVSDNITRHDLTKFPWPIKDQEFDLCLSVGVLEHIPQKFIGKVISEIERTCKRGLHGIVFQEYDDKTDKARCTILPEGEWRKWDWGMKTDVTSVHKLEQGNISERVFLGDGKTKLNIGSFTTMYHYGWTNIDVHDLGNYANSFGYRFLKHDVRQGLPMFKTGSVDLIMMCHFLEHLNYQEGLAFLRECRRIIKTDGAIRILVPDAEWLNSYNHEGTIGLKGEPGAEVCKLDDFDCMNEGCLRAPTAVSKLHAMLYAGHNAIYDYETIQVILNDAGFNSFQAYFRKPYSDDIRSKQILHETLDLLPCLSLYVDALPQVGDQK